MKYTKEQLEKMIKSEDWRDRVEVAKQGYGLDRLINDKDWIVRREVARQGYGLERLIFDKDCYVREIALDRLKELVEEGEVEVIIKRK